MGSPAGMMVSHRPGALRCGSFFAETPRNLRPRAVRFHHYNAGSGLTAMIAGHGEPNDPVSGAECPASSSEGEWRCVRPQAYTNHPGWRGETLSRLRIVFLASVALAGVFWASACGDGATEPPPHAPPRASTVTVTPLTARFTALGATVQLSAQVLDQNGQTMAGAVLAWSSGSTTIATVNGSGLVTAMQNGTVTIMATSGSASGSAEVTVAQSPDSVTVVPAQATIVALGDTLRLQAEAFDGNGHAVADAEFSWGSSDDSVATVDGSGLVMAAGNGAASVTATAGGASGAAEVTVAQSPDSVAVVPAQATIAALGDTLRLQAEAFDANGYEAVGAKFTWSSSDPSVAQVDVSGLVRGVGEGMATVTAASAEATGGSEITVINSDRQVLVAFYNSTGGPNWTRNENWLTGSPLGEWYGVKTDRLGRVVRLHMSEWVSQERSWISNNLSGSIPAELGGLSSLLSLRLSHNDLTGSMPPELGNLANLTSLELEANRLTGSIPTELGNLGNLRLLKLSGNNLSGPIPSQLGNLANLTWLSLHSGGLSGAIPPELGNLGELTFLRLSSNNLTGPIPPELGKLAKLTNLWLYQNDLSGKIPPELVGLTDLTNLYLYNNSFTGPIPSEVGSMTSLRILHLAGNELSGPIPPELGSLAELKQVDIYDNRLTDPVPKSLLDISSLMVFRFHRNDGLCAPGTAGFADWLEGVERHEGPFCNETDRGVLSSLFETAGGSGWTNAEGWLGTAVLAGWHGVSADSLGHVTALDLSRNGLVGRLPRTMGGLAQLAELRLDGNPDLFGRLPSSLVGLSLHAFHFLDTGLCVPAGQAFSEWLNGIPSHEGTGVECEALSDREILEALYDATAGPDWTNSHSWLTAAPIGDWYGVRVDGQGRVTELSLLANNLRGSIPTELGSLATMERLSLARNRLSGVIPAELGNLANLQRLSLNSNALEGRIPAKLGNLANLQKLYLEDNALNGMIPVELGGLTRLQELDLGENQLDGPVPAELGNLGNIRYLEAADNSLTGSIPVALGSLATIRRLSLSRNSLTGRLPPQLADLANLEGLYLGDNDLEGPVPPEFGGLARLKDLALSGNPGMSGALPASLTNLQSLQALQAGGTGLCAPADDDFVKWLERLSSRRIAICGTMPATAYLVQAVQSRDFPVPLVAGEEALLRVFVTAAGTNQEHLPAVRASFYLEGAVAYVAEVPRKPGPIPTDVNEGSLARSANAVIPAEVIQPGLAIVIEIDPDRTLDPALGVAHRVPETGRIPVDVRGMPVFDLTVIPFLWSADPDSAILEQTEDMAADPAGHGLLELTRILLPVADLNVTAHKPVLTSSNNGYVLFAETRAIQALEGGRGHYMGMISGALTGAGGLAARPGRTTFVRNRASTIAHELGHNVSLQHGTAPGVGGVDPAYPYPGGSIGAWGYDFRDGGRLVSPNARDVMAGGGSMSWISDYHFNKALRFRLTDEALSGPASPTTSLLVWGGADSVGVPYLEPAFVVDASPTLPGSGGEYRLTGRTRGGDELFSLSFDMPTVVEGDGSSSFAFVLPVRSEWDRGLASIKLAGPGGSVTLDAESDIPMAILRDPGTGEIRGFLRDVPATRPSFRDAVAAVSADSLLEVLFSRGIPDAARNR